MRNFQFISQETHPTILESWEMYANLFQTRMTEPIFIDSVESSFEHSIKVVQSD